MNTRTSFMHAEHTMHSYLVVADKCTQHQSDSNRSVTRSALGNPGIPERHTSSTYLTSATRPLRYPGPSMLESLLVQTTKLPTVASPISGLKLISKSCTF